MEIGIDAIATALMFCWAGVAFLLAFLFRTEKRKLENKMKTLKTIEYSRKCFSIEWNEDQGKQKVIVARWIYVMIPFFVGIIMASILLSILHSFGYAMFVAVIGFPMFLDDVFAMYSYSRNVRKEERLQKKDREYMEIALKVLASRLKIYLIIGLVLSIAALFTPQLFNLIPFVVANLFRLPFLFAEKFGIGGAFLAAIIYVVMITLLGLMIRLIWRLIS